MRGVFNPDSPMMRALGVVYGHLRAGVQRNVRQGGAQHARESQILHKDRVRPSVRRLLRERGGSVHLAVKKTARRWSAIFSSHSGQISARAY